MSNRISTYIIFSEQEQARRTQLQKIQEYFADLTIVDAIFPSMVRVPFLERLIAKSKERTGTALLENEIGVLMSHRKVWHEIVLKAKDPNMHYLVLESDSKVKNIQLIEKYYHQIQSKFDLFFWGAWNGNATIRHSTKIILEKGVEIGEPMIKSIYGAYGYSINANGAKYMLKKSAKIAYPVDLYKHYVNLKELKVGVIQPEQIGTWLTTDSTIRIESKSALLKRNLIIKIFNCRNKIHAYFC